MRVNQVARYFLSELRVEGFRGINNEGDPLSLTFDPEAVNSVFATNGSGKSSLFEALQFAFSGRVARLQTMQAAEQPDTYLSNLFHTSKTSTIHIRLTPDDGTPDIEVLVTRDPEGNRSVSSPSGHTAPEELLHDLNQDFALLDYAKFSKFIEDTALSRGRSFSSLLGLSEYADLRRALKAVAHTQTFRSDFEIAQLEEQKRSYEGQLSSAIQEYLSGYREVVGEPLSDESKVDESSDAIVKALSDVPLILDHVKDQTLETLDFDEILRRVSAAEDGEARSRLESLLQEKQNWSRREAAPSDIQENLTRVRAAMVTHEELLAQTAGAAKHALLASAERFLQAETNWNSWVCPLCNGEVPESIEDHVRAELKTFELADESQTSIFTCLSGGEFYKRLQFLEQLPEILSEDETALAGRLLNDAREGGLAAQTIEIAQARLDALEARVDHKLKDVEQQIDALQRSLPPSLVALTKQITNAKQARTALKTITSMRTAHNHVTSQLDIFERWRMFTSEAHDIFGTAESDISKKVLADLQEDYQELFYNIMSVEDVVPTLSRDRAGERLDVELQEFHGHQGVSARALLSESYRNALAISVFLSASAKHGSSPRFVVLDDITSSFDSGHQYRLMEQIRTRLQYPSNPAGLQFIILSHDVTLEKYFDRLGDEPGWKHQKLQGWPPLTAVSAVGQDPNRLRSEANSFLQAGRTDQASGLIRQYLEFTLLQVIRKMKIGVPIDLAINDHSKMAGKCVESILDNVELHRKAGDLCLEQQQITDLTRRHVPALVANWINHYGTAGSAPFSPPALKGVLADIDALRRCFQFDASGTGDWRFYKSLSQRS